MVASKPASTIKKEIADVQDALKVENPKAVENLKKEKVEAIEVLKVNVNNAANKEVFDAIVSVVKTPAEQKFLAETLGLAWDKLEVDGVSEVKDRKFLYKQMHLELDDLAKSVEPVEVETSLEANKKQLNKGIYLYSKFEDFKKIVLADVKEMQKVVPETKGTEKEGLEGTVTKFTDTQDALHNRLSKMFPEEFKKKDWAAIETKLDKSEFKKEWETKHKAKKYEINPKEGSEAFQKNINTIPRYEYEEVERGDGNETLKYSENAQAYVDALNAGFRGSYEKYRDLMPKSTMEEWEDKGKKFMEFAGNMLEKLFTPFRKMLSKWGVDMAWMDSFMPKGKEEKMEAFNKKENEGMYPPEKNKKDGDVSKTQVEKEVIAIGIEETLVAAGAVLTGVDNMAERLSSRDLEDVKTIVEENAGKATPLGLAMKPEKNEGKEISFQSLLLLKELTERDGYELVTKQDPNNNSSVIFYKQEKDKPETEAKIDLTDEKIFQAVVEKKEVNPIAMRGIPVSGVVKGKIVKYGEEIDKFYGKDADKIEGNEITLRNALTGKVIRKMLENIDEDSEVASQIKGDAGILPLPVLQSLARMDHIEIEKNGFNEVGGLWSGDLKMRFVTDGKWYDFDTFGQLGQIIKKFEVSERRDTKPVEVELKKNKDVIPVKVADLVDPPKNTEAKFISEKDGVFTFKMPKKPKKEKEVFVESNKNVD